MIGDVFLQLCMYYLEPELSWPANTYSRPSIAANPAPIRGEGANSRVELLSSVHTQVTVSSLKTSFNHKPAAENQPRRSYLNQVKQPKDGQTLTNFSEAAE